MKRFLLNINVHGVSGLMLFSYAAWIQDSAVGGAGFIVTNTNLEILCVGCYPLNAEFALVAEALALKFALRSVRQ